MVDGGTVMATKEGINYITSQELTAQEQYFV